MELLGLETEMDMRKMPSPKRLKSAKQKHSYSTKRKGMRWTLGLE